MTSRILCLAALLCGLTQIALADRTVIELTDPGRPTRLRVELEWGSIRIVGDAAAGAVVVDAVPDRPDELTGALIHAAEADNRVEVRQAPLPSGTFRSANLEIRTPPRTDLELVMNRGGDIRVEGVEGLVEVTNLNGSVDLERLSGAAAVNASNGSIRAGFAAVDAARDMIFASLNGSVELCLPPEFSGRLALSTAGDPIRSDFAVARDATPRTVGAGEALTAQGSELTGRIGDGEALLRVSTLNGEIYLRRCD